MTDYLILFAIVLAVNMMPAFGPPTWSIIILYGLGTKMPLPALILTAATAAALGRYALAVGFRLLRNRVPTKWKRNAEAAGVALERKRRRLILGLGLFAISPLPSAQLFEAAGLAGLRLLPFTAAFFAGRIASYTVYGLGAKGIEKTSLGAAFRDSLTSPVGIAIQIAMIGLLVAVGQVDWKKRLGGGKGARGAKRAKGGKRP
jgi:membrane protein YqaA with SNARE-associated domain